MKITHRALVINIGIFAIMGLSTGSASAVACTPNSYAAVADSECPRAEPYCNASGIYMEPGVCGATYISPTSRTTAPASNTTAPLTTTTRNPNGTITTCTCDACTTTQAPTTPYTQPRTINPAPQPSEYCIVLGGRWVNGICTGMGSTIRPTTANVFEALWNFITHKRGK